MSLFILQTIQKFEEAAGDTLINLKGINSILDKDNRTHNNPFIMKIPENIVVL